jgi:hypothetical protein
MCDNPCNKEIIERDEAIKELDAIRNRIQSHLSDPLNLRSESPESYYEELENLRKEEREKQNNLEDKERALRDCEEK